MAEIIGHITLVQEDRFRLATWDGRSLLLTLAHNSRLKPDTLHFWYKNGSNLLVSYEGEAGTESATAHSVRALE